MCYTHSTPKNEGGKKTNDYKAKLIASFYYGAGFDSLSLGFIL